MEQTHEQPVSESTPELLSSKFIDPGKIHVLHVRDITVGDRTRKEPGDITELCESLAGRGQLNPITVERREDRTILVAGFRRLAAAGFLLTEGRNVRGLEPGCIECRFLNELTDVERLSLEFDENRQRKDFNKAEDALMISRLKEAMEREQGRELSTREVGELLGFSTGQVSMAQRVAKAVSAGNTELLQAASIRGAYQKLQASEKLSDLLERAEAIEVAEGTVGQFEEMLHCGDALKWIKTLMDESVDFVNFDPPWGIGIDSYDRNHHYGDFDDSAEMGISIAKALIPELYRVMKVDTYMVVWFGIQYYQFLTELLTDAGFKVNPVPHIWFKPDKAGAQNDPTRTTINAWEPFFIVSKGDPRMYKHAQTNVLEYPMPRGADRVHFAQKSNDLLIDIIERFSFGHMLVLDPTFGSGSALVAARRIGRQIIGCEKSEDNYKNAISALRRSLVE